MFQDIQTKYTVNHPPRGFIQRSSMWQLKWIYGSTLFFLCNIIQYISIGGHKLRHKVVLFHRTNTYWREGTRTRTSSGWGDEEWVVLKWGWFRIAIFIVYFIIILGTGVVRHIISHTHTLCLCYAPLHIMVTGTEPPTTATGWLFEAFSSWVLVMCLAVLSRTSSFVS